MSNFLRRARLPAIALLALASSAIGVVNQFAYDDDYIILKNDAVHTLHHWWSAFSTSYWPKAWGGDGYRPLTMLSFRTEWVIGHGSPLVFHAANVLLYVACAVLMYALAVRLLPPAAAWLAAALFAVHPVHVEAVANVVGQSELLVGVAVLAAMLLYLRDRQSGDLRRRTMAIIALLYAFACFAKEHGVVLIALLGAVDLLLVHDQTPVGERVRRLRPFYLLLVAVAVFFVGVRALVLAGHGGVGGFQPFTPFSSLHISTPDRILTAFSVVPQWIRLLYWPAHLSSEYGPPAIRIAQGFGLWELPGMVLLLAVLALAVVLWRRRPALSFGIAVICITLLPSSNFILPAGIVLAERTLFLPSVGAMLVLGDAVAWAASTLRERVNGRWALVSRVAAGVLILTGCVWSSVRTRVWHDNARLFAQTVLDAPDSYRAHFMYGAWLFEQKDRRQGEDEYHRGLALFPYDPGMSFSLAMQYYNAHLCAPALPLFRWTMALAPEFPEGHTAFATCLLEEGRYAEAKAEALRTTRYGRALPILRRLIFLADSAQAADTLGKDSVRGAVVLAGHTGRSPHTVQKTGGQPPKSVSQVPPNR